LRTEGERVVRYSSVTSQVGWCRDMVVKVSYFL